MSATQAKRAPYDVNEATLPNTETTNALNRGDKLETIGTACFLAYDPSEVTNGCGDGFACAVDARFYMARHSDGASPVRCSVWIRTRNGKQYSGSGTASGYGYHKQSAALDAALESAGVTFTKRFDGCGSSAARVALVAVGRACGYGSLPFTIHTTGGAL